MQASSAKPPLWYWIVAALALLWMFFGVLAWFMDLMTDETALEEFTDAQRELYTSRPQWLFLVYAIAVFSGFAGTVGLLLRKAWAVLMFAISLVAIIVQFGYTFLVMDAVQRLGAATALPFPIVIFLIGTGLLVFTIHASKRQWIPA